MKRKKILEKHKIPKPSKEEKERKISKQSNRISNLKPSPNIKLKPGWLHGWVPLSI